MHGKSRDNTIFRTKCKIINEITFKSVKKPYNLVEQWPVHILRYNKL